MSEQGFPVSSEVTSALLQQCGAAFQTAFLLITDISKIDVELSCIYAALSHDDGSITYSSFNLHRNVRQRINLLLALVKRNIDRSPYLPHLLITLESAEPIFEWRNTLSHGVLIVDERGLPCIRSRVVDKLPTNTIPLIDSKLRRLRDYSLKLVTVVESTLIDLGERDFVFGDVNISVRNDSISVRGN